VQRTLTVQEGSPSAVFTTIFAADGTLLTGSWDGIVQRWNTLTGLQVSPPTLTEEAPVSGLALSPDGTRFATTGGSSGDLKVWDLHARQQIGSTLPGTAGMWGNAAYTPDGAKLVVVYLDTTGELWPVSVSAWMDHACAVAHRNLSEEEWSRFVPSHPYTRTCPQYPSG
jgi:WD40 repeat protein